MTSIDHAVLLFLNRLAGGSWTFDTIVAHVSQSHALKGGLVAALMWGLWFRHEEDAARGHIIVTVLASLVALAAARALALALPFRQRPLHDPALAFVLPHGVPETRLEAWSAMPSDHAVLFVALATGIWFVSRAAGIAAMLHAALIILLPRLYLGLHYPSDIAVGALLGGAIALAANGTAPGRAIARPALRWHRASPATFYAAFFLLFFQIAVMLQDGRDALSVLYRLIAPHL